MWALITGLHLCSADRARMLSNYVLNWKTVVSGRHANIQRKAETPVTHFHLGSMVISCYGGMESQSNQAPVGATSTSTSVNSGGFIMMNAVNIGRMSHLPIDFQLRPNGKYVESSTHGITVIFIRIDDFANGALM